MSQQSSWIDRYVSTVERYTDSPTIFIRTAAYFVAGAAIRKLAYFRESKNLFPNLYYVLVAPPARFRKTHALNLGLTVLEEVVPCNHFLPQGGSDQGFDVALVQTDGYGIAYYEELMKFLALSSREHTSQMGVKFLEYFDPSGKDTVTRTKKDGELVIPKGTCSTFASACTDDDFLKFMSSGAVSSGQLSRCLVVSPSEEDIRPTYTTVPIVPDHFYHSMASDLKSILPKFQTEYRFTKDALDEIASCDDAVSEWHEENHNYVLRKSTARVTHILKRLALITAVMRGSKNIVEPEDVQAAWTGLVSPHYLRTIKYFARFGQQERSDQMLRTNIQRRLEGAPSTVLILARDLNEKPEHVFMAVMTLLKHGSIFKETFKGVSYWRSYDQESDIDPNTPIAKEEKIIRELRKLLKEDGKPKKAGNIIRVEHEEKV